MKPKSWTLRIDDIPLGTSADTLASDLRSILPQGSGPSSDTTDVRVRSLVPWDQYTLCATAAFRTALKAEDLCRQLNEGRGDYPFTFTSKFEGITPLHADQAGADIEYVLPSHCSHVLDGTFADFTSIIAVPGLGCNPLGSWRSPTNDDVWLRDFLPKALPKIRVLLYGYDTTLEDSRAKQSIEDLGSGFLEQIVAFRADDGVCIMEPDLLPAKANVPVQTSLRPIIFIGHSLGGLVIKQALVLARRKSSDENTKLSKASYGLLLFGVPNLGLRNEQLRALVKGQPNRFLVDDILVDSDSEPSRFLKQLADQFSESCKGRHKVISFYETKYSPTLQVRF